MNLNKIFNYDVSWDNIIFFPYLLFVALFILIGLYLFKYKKYTIKLSLLVGIYISFITCTLFFPIVTNWGEAYNFIDEVGFMFLSWHPIARIEYHPLYSIYQLVMFIPLGFLIKKQSSFKKSIFIAILIVFGIENIQIIINFLCHYIQYTYDICDIIFHIVSFVLGIVIGYIPFYKISIKLKELWDYV